MTRREEEHLKKVVLAIAGAVFLVMMGFALSAVVYRALSMSPIRATPKETLKYANANWEGGRRRRAMEGYEYLMGINYPREEFERNEVYGKIVAFYANQDQDMEARKWVHRQMDEGLTPHIPKDNTKAFLIIVQVRAERRESTYRMKGQ